MNIKPVDKIERLYLEFSVLPSKRQLYRARKRERESIRKIQGCSSNEGVSYEKTEERPQSNAEKKNIYDNKEYCGDR